MNVLTAPPRPDAELPLTRARFVEIVARIFPDTNASRSRPPARVLLQNLLLVCVAMVVQLSANHFTLARRVWAEDGSQVLNGIYNHGAGVTLQPFHGYLNLFHASRAWSPQRFRSTWPQRFWRLSMP